MRSFISIFGLGQEHTTSLTKLAVAAVRAGYAIVPVTPGGKIPMCSLTDRERKAEPDHKCGVYHAITDAEKARKLFARLEADPAARPNIGIVAHPSRLVIVDCDTADQSQAFCADWAGHTGDPGYLTHSPTVATPGSRNADGTWRHRDGGHFYFTVPDGVDLTITPASFRASGGYEVKWGMSMAVAPPSVREEGPYLALGDIVNCPTWLLDAIAARTTSYTSSSRDIEPDSAIAAWATEHPWSDLLTDHGWNEAERDDACGCPIWSKPGGDTSNPRSATAHNDDCARYPNVEGHGPLHLWTTDPPEELQNFIDQGTQTITKLQYVAAMEHHGDLGALRRKIDVARIDDSWDLNQTDDTEIDLRDDHPDRDAVTHPQLSDIVTAPASAAASSPGFDYTTAISQEIQRLGVPETLTRDVESRLKSRLIDEVVNAVLATARRGTGGALDTWIQSDDFAKNFVSGTREPGPTLVQRTDGQALIYRGRVNVISGRRGSGKTWLALLMCALVLQDGLRILYYDMEDREDAWHGRFEDIGVDIDSYALAGQAVWIKPEDLPVADIQRLVDYTAQFDMVVFDVVNRLITRLGGTPDNGNNEMLWLYDNLFDPLAGRDVAVLLLDHPNKAGQRREAKSVDDLSPGGGAMKMNNASGLVIGLNVVDQFTRDKMGGRVDLICLKDRSGHFEEGTAIGHFTGTMGIDHGLIMDMAIEPPNIETTGDEFDAEIDKTKQSILRVLGNRQLNKSAIRPKITTSQRGWIDVALEQLLTEGRITETDGKYTTSTDHPDAPDEQ